MSNHLGPVERKTSRKKTVSPEPLHIRYIWPNSIPETWKKIIDRKNISITQVDKGERKTLEFLKETQQYINHITKPIPLYKGTEESKSSRTLPKLGIRGDKTQKTILASNQSAELLRSYDQSPVPIKLHRIGKKKVFSKLQHRLSLKRAFETSLKTKIENQESLKLGLLTDRKKLKKLF